MLSKRKTGEVLYDCFNKSTYDKRRLHVYNTENATPESDLGSIITDGGILVRQDLVVNDHIYVDNVDVYNNWSVPNLGYLRTFNIKFNPRNFEQINCYDNLRAGFVSINHEAPEGDYCRDKNGSIVYEDGEPRIKVTNKKYFKLKIDSNYAYPDYRLNMTDQTCPSTCQALIGQGCNCGQTCQCKIPEYDYTKPIEHGGDNDDTLSLNMYKIQEVTTTSTVTRKKNKKSNKPLQVTGEYTSTIPIIDETEKCCNKNCKCGCQEPEEDPEYETITTTETNEEKCMNVQIRNDGTILCRRLIITDEGHDISQTDIKDVKNGDMKSNKIDFSEGTLDDLTINKLTCTGTTTLSGSVEISGNNTTFTVDSEMTVKGTKLNVESNEISIGPEGEGESTIKLNQNIKVGEEDDEKTIQFNVPVTFSKGSTIDNGEFKTLTVKDGTILFEVNSTGTTISKPLTANTITSSGKITATGINITSGTSSIKTEDSKLKITNSELTTTTVKDTLTIDSGSKIIDNNAYSSEININCTSEPVTITGTLSYKYNGLDTVIRIKNLTVTVNETENNIVYYIGNKITATVTPSGEFVLNGSSKNNIVELEEDEDKEDYILVGIDLIKGDQSSYININIISTIEYGKTYKSETPIQIIVF